PDSIDLVVASKSTATLSELMPHIVQDAKLLRGSLNDEERKRFVSDIVALFEATKNMLEAAKEDRKKLDKSAVEFGNKSAKLLYVVSTDVDPGQEKEVLERVRNINENASRLAVLGADSASHLPAPQLQALCRAGARAAGAATTLAYTAKLVAPSIQNAECNEALTNAANDLSTHLQTYSSTWAPLEASPQSSSITELRTEAASLERLLEELRRDLGTGKLVKRRTVERVVVEDTPLRRLACVVQEEAKKRAESTNTLPELRAKYAKYANELGQVVKQLDLAYHRCRQAPQDLEKRQELEYAVQNLQITLLQTRPSLDGTPQSNIVDLTEYVKEVSNDADKLIKECEKGPPELTNILGSIQERCSQIVSRAARLTTADSYDQAEEAGWMEIEQFAEECDQHLNGINYMLENLNDGKLKIDLQEKATRLSEDCNMLRFATKCALASSQGVSLDATLDDLTDLEGKIDEMLAEGDSSHVMPSWSSDYGRGRLVAATARAGAGIAHDLPPAFTSYMDDVRTRTDLSNEPERNQSKQHLRKVLGLLKALTMTTSRHVATWQPLGQPEAAAVTGQILKELDSHHSRVNATKGKPPRSALADLDMNQLLYPPTIKVEGDQKQISDKLQQAASKLSTATSTIMQSAHKPESLSRSAHAAAAAAAGLAAHARALRTNVTFARGFTRVCCVATIERERSCDAESYQFKDISLRMPGL
ncbi:uncharacterized protein LOC114366657, partial [Ostrinia furnacalis]|uniref:uncharacterized protein LOC114366657 n=1 Tax=Ostrinia furnacalis TaxID=93504 RepID=UPI00103E38D9